MDKKEHITKLFEKYLNDQYTEDELNELIDYFHSNEHEEHLLHLLEDNLSKNPSVEKETILSIDKKIAQNLFKRTRPTRIRKLRKLLAYASAILVFFIAGLGIYHYLLSEKEKPAVYSNNTESIILPGGNRATITLDNGQVVSLSEDQEGILHKDNRLVYADGATVEDLETAQLITLSTPKAGQYTVTLNDGTKVWLNAVSEIKFPSKFDSKERRVEIKGEVYFEVAPDEQRPFIVHTEKQNIRVLGTQFNVQAYNDEPLQYTTLIEGKVAVRSNEGHEEFHLTAGQQAISRFDNELTITKVDPSEYTSWKDGIITLNNYNLTEILRQLERWYDVSFERIPEGVGAERIFGMISRDVTLNDLLETLTDNYKRIKFQIEGRRIMILKE